MKHANSARRTPQITRLHPHCKTPPPLSQNTCPGLLLQHLLACVLCSFARCVSWHWSSVFSQACKSFFFSKQHGITVENALPEVSDSTQRGIIYQQLVELTDAVLDGFRAQLDSIKLSAGESVHYMEVLRQYEMERSRLLAPFSESPLC